MLTRMGAEEDGQTLIEYGMLISLLSIVLVATLMVLGRKTRDVYVMVNGSLTTSA